MKIYGEIEQCYLRHYYGGELWASGSSRIIAKEGDFVPRFRSRLDGKRKISATLKNRTPVVQFVNSQHRPIYYTLILTFYLLSHVTISPREVTFLKDAQKFIMKYFMHFNNYKYCDAAILSDYIYYIWSNRNIHRNVSLNKRIISNL